MRQISKEKLASVVDVLNIINDRLSAKEHINSEVMRSLLRSSKLTTAIFYDAVKLKYFTMIERGVYKCNIDIFTPYQARKVYELGLKNRNEWAKKRRVKESSVKTLKQKRAKQSEYSKRHYIKNKESIMKRRAEREKEVSLNPIPNKCKPIQRTKKPTSTRANKEFSLFWGLLKFNY